MPPFRTTIRHWRRGESSPGQIWGHAKDVMKRYPQCPEYCEYIVNICEYTLLVGRTSKLLGAILPLGHPQSLVWIKRVLRNHCDYFENYTFRHSACPHWTHRPGWGRMCEAKTGLAKGLHPKGAKLCVAMGLCGAPEGAMVLRTWALLHGLWMTVFGMLRHGRTTVQNSSDLSDLSISLLDQIFSGWKWGDFRGSFEFSRWSLKGWYHQWFCGSARDWRSIFCRSTMMPLKPTRWGASAPRGGWEASGWRWSRFVSYHATWSRLDKMMSFLSRNYGLALSAAMMLVDSCWF
jgi:hypothetical protein